ncbi:hypothetical protein AAFF_G00432750 [Aldrovandia affinis]|uniref:Uncharacterized protein n=1 Tax=Aldrovandia affinis TaxID=143900 RepID=A0AAD7S8L8_9TELE|nr:hypothetical protein AAFF_G00432750 [Aldrovandia affinis]
MPFLSPNPSCFPYGELQPTQPVSRAQGPWSCHSQQWHHTQCLSSNRTPQHSHTDGDQRAFTERSSLTGVHTGPPGNQCSSAQLRPLPCVPHPEIPSIPRCFPAKPCLFENDRQGPGGREHSSRAGETTGNATGNPTPGLLFLQVGWRMSTPKVLPGNFEEHRQRSAAALEVTGLTGRALTL